MPSTSSSATSPPAYNYSPPIPTNPFRPPGLIHRDLSIFTLKGQGPELSKAIDKLSTLIRSAPHSNSFLPSIVHFLDEVQKTTREDQKAVATLAAKVWLDQLSSSLGIPVPTSSTTSDSPSQWKDLSLARLAAIKRNSEPTLTRAASVHSPVVTLHPADLGRERNVATANLGLPVALLRPEANDPQGLILSSPLTRLKRREDCNPYARVGTHESYLYERVVSDLRCRYDAFLDSGATIPPDPLDPEVDSGIPAHLLEAHRVSREGKGKPPLEGPHHRLKPLAMIQQHLDKSNEECIYCAQGTCYIFHTAALAAGSPLPFLAGQRPVPSFKSSMYPLNEEDQKQVTGELVGYWKQGVVRTVPASQPLLVHPIFVVTKYRFAPPANELADLYRKPGLFEKLLELASGVVADACSRQSKAFPFSPPNRLDPSALSESLGKHCTDPKQRLVVDYGKNGLNDCLADHKFKYTSVGRMISTLRPGMYVASVDISAAFVTLPVHPEDQSLLGMSWPASGHMLPNGELSSNDHLLRFEQQQHLFGSKCLPAQFSTLSAEMVRTLVRRSQKYRDAEMVEFLAYMDDVFLFAQTLPLAEKACKDLREYMHSIGAKLNDKARPPSQTGIPILGLEIDTLAMTVSLPLAKAYSTGLMTAVAIKLLTAGIVPPQNFWEKVLGKLEHASYATLGGAGRLSRIRHAILEARENPDGHEAVPLDRSPYLLDCLFWWLHALTDAPPSARLFTSCAASSPGAELRTRSDASGNIGAGMHCGDSLVMHCLWTDGIAQDPSIQLKELYPIILFLERYGNLLQGLSLPFGTDNLPNVYAVNKRSMRDPTALPWLVYLNDLADFHHILLLPTWVPREANAEADRSSKSTSTEEVASLYAGFERVE